MRSDLITFKTVYSSFQSCDKDLQKILKTLFVTSNPYSDILKKLLVINNKDCLKDSEEYQTVIDNLSLGDLIDRGYIRLNPKISRGTHQEIKTYILISFDDFSPTVASNQYRDYTINFDIVCYNDAWVLDDLLIRPLMICGYIDGILNSLTDLNKKQIKSYQPRMKLSGIGQYRFLGCHETVLNEDLSMYTLSYRGMHLTEDIKTLGAVEIDE